MIVLINLIPIKKGGGQQVASNFIEQMPTFVDIMPIYLVTKDSYICNKLLKCGIPNVHVVKDTLVARFIFSVYGIRTVFQKYNIDLIYTLFGPGLRYKNTLSVTGCAYSNLFFPEVNFWGEYSFYKRLKLKIIDKYRLKKTLNSDAIIFENKAMLERAISLYSYPVNKVTLILPSISEYPVGLESEDFANRLIKINSKHYNILMLIGWHKNKNIEMIPSILYELKQRGINDVSFVITISKEHPEMKNIYLKASELGVAKNICFFDAIMPHEVPAIFQKIDGVMVLSLLESFSNNIIEAWHFQKPLFISDEIWSRAICEDAAIYVNRDNPKNIAGKVIACRNQAELSERVLIASQRILLNYPSPYEKVKLQLDYLKNVCTR
jgi:hypothetical protein